MPSPEPNSESSVIYGTQEGWAHNHNKFQWELYDVSGSIRAWITDEEVFVMRQYEASERRKLQAFIVYRYGIALPALDSTDTDAK